MPPGQSHGTAWPLIIGVVTVIAAYVMAEASRIAAENAEIV
jgi:asparagine N-glycosylation enzyme membrane subunit Stt3